MKKKLLRAGLYIIFFGSIISAVIYYFYFYHHEKKSNAIFSGLEKNEEEQQENLHQEAQKQIHKKKKKTKGKEKSEHMAFLDLPELQKKNQDIYAWIEIPGTRISYPVLHHKTDDYYLLHNIDHSTGYPGCIYSNGEKEHAFSEGMTILYGHNMKNETMFGSLYHFRDTSFFDSNPYIYIYTEKEVIVYEIMAVKEWSNQHIWKEYNPNEKKEIEAFIKEFSKKNSIQYRAMDNRNRDHVLVLSTCVRGKASKRLLVVGLQV